MLWDKRSGDREGAHREQKAGIGWGTRQGCPNRGGCARRGRRRLSPAHPGPVPAQPRRTPLGIAGRRVCPAAGIGLRIRGQY